MQQELKHGYQILLSRVLSILLQLLINLSHPDYIARNPNVMADQDLLPPPLAPPTILQPTNNNATDASQPRNCEVDSSHGHGDDGGSGVGVAQAGNGVSGAGSAEQGEAAEAGGGQGAGLARVKSLSELEHDFKENEKILNSLSFNIEDLFKKITSLTESVQSDLTPKPLLSSSQQLPSPPLAHHRHNHPHEHPYKSEPLIPPPPQIYLAPYHLPSSQTQPPDGISMRMFQIGHSLGHGKFGEVLQCRHKQTGMLFALKKIFKSTIAQYKMQQQLLVELQASKRMSHVNITRSYLSFTDEFHIFLLAEYACGTKLTKKFRSPEPEVSRIIRQVLLGIAHMHEHGVTHRDLKPQNIIIDCSGVIKICDFGWASLQPAMDILCGTLDYVCPEMVLQQQYSQQVDLWSVGVLAYELVCGVAPFGGVDRAATFEKVRKLDYRMEGASGECADFVRRLLVPEGVRMRMHECLAHPFITRYFEEGEANSDPAYDFLFK